MPLRKRARTLTLGSKQVPASVLMVLLLITGAGATTGLVILDSLRGENSIAVSQALLVVGVEECPVGSDADEFLGTVNDDGTAFAVHFEANNGDYVCYNLKVANEADQIIVAKMRIHGGSPYTFGSDPLFWWSDTDGDGDISQGEVVIITEDTILDRNDEIRASGSADFHDFTANHWFFDASHTAAGTYGPTNQWGPAYNDNIFSNYDGTTPEAILLDDGDGILNPGTLNGVGSSDQVITSGKAALHRDVGPYGFSGTPPVSTATGKLHFYDTNGNGVWDYGEDLFLNQDGDAYYTQTQDTLISDDGSDLRSGGAGTQDNSIVVGQQLSAFDASDDVYWYDQGTLKRVDNGDSLWIDMADDGVYNAHGMLVSGAGVSTNLVNTFDAQFNIDLNGGNNPADTTVTLENSGSIGAEVLSTVGLELPSGAAAGSPVRLTVGGDNHYYILNALPVSNGQLSTVELIGDVAVAGDDLKGKTLAEMSIAAPTIVRAKTTYWVDTDHDNVFDVGETVSGSSDATLEESDTVVAEGTADFGSFPVTHLYWDANNDGFYTDGEAILINDGDSILDTGLLSSSPDSLVTVGKVPLGEDLANGAGNLVYYNPATAGWGTGEDVIVNYDGDGHYTTLADVLIDGDGATTSDIGLGAAITAGDGLTAFEAGDKVYWYDQGTAGSFDAGSGGSGTDKMYWMADTGKRIYRADLDGSNLEVVIDGQAGGNHLTVDFDNGKLYWATGSQIKRSELDGTSITTLLSSGNPTGIAIDNNNNHIYWTDDASAQIKRSNLDGSGTVTLISGLVSPHALDIDVDGGKMYWTDYHTDEINRANLDGTGKEKLSSIETSYGIALDLVNDKVYWTDTNGVRLDIRRADLDGSNVEIVLDSLNSPWGLDLDVSNGKMYWTSYNGGKVHRADLDGSNAEELVDQSGIKLRGLALGISEASDALWYDDGADSRYAQTGASVSDNNPSTDLSSIFDGALKIDFDGNGATTYYLENSGAITSETSSTVGLESAPNSVVGDAVTVDGSGYFYIVMAVSADGERSTMNILGEEAIAGDALKGQNLLQQALSGVTQQGTVNGFYVDADHSGTYTSGEALVRCTSTTLTSSCTVYSDGDADFADFGANIYHADGDDGPGTNDNGYNDAEAIFDDVDTDGVIEPGLLNTGDFRLRLSGDADLHEDLGPVTNLGSLVYYNKANAGWQNDEDIFVNADGDGYYTGSADTLIDADGDSTTDAGTASGSPSAGDTLTAFEAADKIYWNDQGTTGSFDGSDALWWENAADGLYSASGASISGANPSTDLSDIFDGGLVVSIDGGVATTYYLENAGEITANTLSTQGLEAAPGSAVGEVVKLQGTSNYYLITELSSDGEKSTITLIGSAAVDGNSLAGVTPDNELLEQNLGSTTSRATVNGFFVDATHDGEYDSDEALVRCASTTLTATCQVYFDGSADFEDFTSGHYFSDGDDGPGSNDDGYTNGEAIFLNDGDDELEAGLLNVGEFLLKKSGDADLQEDLGNDAGKLVYFNEGAAGWAAGEDIFWNLDGDGYYTGSADTAIDCDGDDSDGADCPGSQASIAAGDTLTAFDASDDVYWHDADSSGTFNTGDSLWFDGNDDGTYDGTIGTSISDSNPATTLGTTFDGKLNIAFNGGSASTYTLENSGAITSASLSTLGLEDVAHADIAAGDIVKIGTSYYIVNSKSSDLGQSSTLQLIGDVATNGDDVVTAGTVTEQTPSTITTASISYGSEYQFFSDRTPYTDAVYDPDEDRVIAIFQDINNNRQPTTTVGDVSGNTISWGSSQVVDSNVRLYYGTESTYDTTDDVVVIMYVDSDDGESGNVRVGKVTGSSKSISFGSEYEFNDDCGSYKDIVYDPSSDRIVVAYWDDTASGRKGSLRVGSVDGSAKSVTWGTEQEFNDADTRDLALTYDSDTNRVILVYKDNGNGGKGTARVLQVNASTNSVTMGSEMVYNGQSSANNVVTYDTASDRVIVAYEESSKGKAIVGQVTGGGTNSITFGSEVQFQSNYVGWMDTVFDSSNNKVVISYRLSSGYGELIAGTVSGNSISFGTSANYTSAAWSPSMTYDSTENKPVVINYDSSDSDGVGYVATISTSISSPGVYVNGAQTNGADGMLTLTIDDGAGANVDASDLDAGEVWALDNDGHLDGSSVYVVINTDAGSSTSSVAILGQASVSIANDLQFYEVSLADATNTADIDDFYLDSGADIASSLDAAIGVSGAASYGATGYSGKYKIDSADTSTSSAVVVTNFVPGTGTNIADDLKLGVANGGTESGGGDYVFLGSPSAGSTTGNQVVTGAGYPFAYDDTDTCGGSGCTTADVYDLGQDIYQEYTHSSLTYSTAADTLVYIGGDGQDVAAGDTIAAFIDDDNIMYLDLVDHSDSYTAGEPLVLTSIDIANDGDLTAASEILARASGTWSVAALDLHNFPASYDFIDVNNDDTYDGIQAIVNNGGDNAKLESGDTVVDSGLANLDGRQFFDSNGHLTLSLDDGSMGTVDLLSHISAGQVLLLDENGDPSDGTAMYVIARVAGTEATNSLQLLGRPDISLANDLLLYTGTLSDEGASTNLDDAYLDSSTDIVAELQAKLGGGVSVSYDATGFAGKYKIDSATTGTSSSVVVTDASTGSNIADDLKLGVTIPKRLFYSVDGSSNGLYILSTTTGAATHVGTSGVSGTTVGLAPSDSPGLLYGSKPVGLQMIDADGSSATTVGTLTMEGTAYDASSDILYGVDGSSFFTVNPATGAIISTLTSPGVDMGGLAFGNSLVYGLTDNGNSLRAYNPSTTSWSSIGSTATFITNPGLAYDPDNDVLYAKGTGPNLYKLNPATGAVTQTIGNTGISGIGGGLAYVSDTSYGGSEHTGGDKVLRGSPTEDVTLGNNVITGSGYPFAFDDADTCGVACTASNGAYEVGQDIYEETTHSSLTYSTSADTVVYNGGTTNVASSGSAASAFVDGDNMMFLDLVDHNDAYTAGEPVVVTDGDIENDGDLTATCEVLERKDSDWSIAALDLHNFPASTDFVDHGNSGAYDGTQAIVDQSGGADAGELEAADTVLTSGLADLVAQQYVDATGIIVLSVDDASLGTTDLSAISEGDLLMLDDDGTPDGVNTIYGVALDDGTNGANSLRMVVGPSQYINDDLKLYTGTAGNEGSSSDTDDYYLDDATEIVAAFNHEIGAAGTAVYNNQYFPGKYGMDSASTASGSAVVVTNATTGTNVADDLKLGLGNGGSEWVGGDLVIRGDPTEDVTMGNNVVTGSGYPFAFDDTDSDGTTGDGAYQLGQDIYQEETHSSLTYTSMADLIVYTGGTTDVSPGNALTAFIDGDNVMYIDGDHDSVYDLDEALLLTPWDVNVTGNDLPAKTQILARADSGGTWSLSVQDLTTFASRYYYLDGVDNNNAYTDGEAIVDQNGGASTSLLEAADTIITPGDADLEDIHTIPTSGIITVSLDDGSGATANLAAFLAGQLAVFDDDGTIDGNSVYGVFLDDGSGTASSLRIAGKAGSQIGVDWNMYIGPITPTGTTLDVDDWYLDSGADIAGSVDHALDGEFGVANWAEYVEGGSVYDGIYTGRYKVDSALEHSLDSAVAISDTSGAGTNVGDDLKLRTVDGVLNYGSDRYFTNGAPSLTNPTDDVTTGSQVVTSLDMPLAFNDNDPDGTQNDGAYQDGQDIYTEETGGALTYTPASAVAEPVVYNGGTTDVVGGGAGTAGSAATYLEAADNIRYRDHDHDETYDLGEFLILSSDGDLDSTDEVLARADAFGTWTISNGNDLFRLETDYNGGRPAGAADDHDYYYIDDNENGLYDDGEAIVDQITGSDTGLLEAADFIISHGLGDLAKLPMAAAASGSVIWKFKVPDVNDRNNPLELKVVIALEDAAETGWYELYTEIYPVNY